MGRSEENSGSLTRPRFPFATFVEALPFAFIENGDSFSTVLVRIRQPALSENP